MIGLMLVTLSETDNPLAIGPSTPWGWRSVRSFEGSRMRRGNFPATPFIKESLYNDIYQCCAHTVAPHPRRDIRTTNLITISLGVEMFRPLISVQGVNDHYINAISLHYQLWQCVACGGIVSTLSVFVCVMVSRGLQQWWFPSTLAKKVWKKNFL